MSIENGACSIFISGLELVGSVKHKKLEFDINLLIFKT